ncbi:YchJ family protein [Dietzia sp. 179-F 9C3 NHS]|uniref:YchJ family protein n=1 Tax=Dietzia sp. 179-F 9C3 NHS TaxID=3374295 RepID=UPI0038796E7D
MRACPCGSGRGLDACCGPLVLDGLPAETAEALMRSRYTAFVLGETEHLWRTWHPRTRPATVDSGGVTWTGLRVLEVSGGGPDEATGVVEFEARFTVDGAADVHRERSTFERRGGRWTYVTG